MMVLAWTTVQVYATARIALGGAGTTSAGLAFGGIISGGTYTAATEEWTWCRFSNNKNNYSKLTGGKYGTYKNIHRS
jgi:hypothetical protein